MNRRSFLKMILDHYRYYWSQLVPVKGIRMTEPGQIVSGVSVVGDVIIESGAHNAIITNCSFTRE